MAKILIVGCGDIGLGLAAVLAQDGHGIVGLKRHPPANASATLTYYRADITVAASLETLDKDFDYLFFIVTPDGRNEQNYRTLYETGVNNLLAHFSAPGPQWFFISSTSVYGQSHGEWIDEDSPAEPNSATSVFIRQAEQRIISAGENNIVVRFSGIYGPGREALLRLAAQTPEIQREPPFYTNRIHRDDCIGVLAFLLRRRLAGRRLEQCYLASDDDPAPLWDVISCLAEQMHCPAPIEKAAEEGAAMNKRCDNRRLKDSGYAFRYPSYKQGYLELLRSKSP